EIIGEISDEFDDLETHYTRVNDNTYLFDGKISINDFCRVVGCDGDIFNDVNADTLAGLILNETGEMPKQYDIVKIGHFVFKIESVDSRRIKKVEVKVEQSE
ncbi:MAG TPA: transporter associated domain-containing protein, partial [Salinivirgaceae bacterium]|nr:transporter associated domain-containing protein [Salinivirgaceae bacterium]